MQHPLRFSLSGRHCGAARRHAAGAARVATGVAVAALLAACAPLSQRLPAGTTVDTVVAAMGNPSVACPLPDGGQQLVWSGQPFSQASWATQVDAQGTSSGIEQVLTDASFARLRKGHWHIDQVRCTFGPPATIERVGLPGSTRLVWSYAYRQDGVWNSLMHVYFDDAGTVTQIHPGPDPTYDPPDWE